MQQGHYCKETFSARCLTSSAQSVTSSSARLHDQYASVCVHSNCIHQHTSINLSIYQSMSRLGRHKCPKGKQGHLTALQGYTWWHKTKCDISYLFFILCRPMSQCHTHAESVCNISEVLIQLIKSLTWPPFTAMIKANCFQNCLTERSLTKFAKKLTSLQQFHTISFQQFSQQYPQYVPVLILQRKAFYGKIIQLLDNPSLADARCCWAEPNPSAKLFGQSSHCLRVHHKTEP